ncbi:alpha-amylase family glycosyl hydrolase [Ornithinibacillus californiensis]|uniref:alpha-amylase family glycosyl hydrolase n=1 Tax=Ornithinibacillus californiensis TaxID=161536 RepID=UPI00064DF9AE|nr:alpha-amylase family glycosyl hydrolase [Ornithinibacillus californiensis]
MKKISTLLIAILLFATTYPAVSFAEDNNIQEEIIYDILVDRFNNGNQAFSDQVRIDDPFAYHGGDIEGITLKLDAIKDLGFTSISLSPIMENSVDGYHGYWIEDFYSIEEQFGTMEEFQTLVQQAHERDMKVILELVINYIGNEHPITTDSEKQDWLVQNAKVETGSEPWLENVSVLNHDNLEVQEMLIDMAKHWMNEGNVDGFKIHAADQASVEFLETLTSELKAENPDLYLIADVLAEDVPEELINMPTLDIVENPTLSQTIADVFAKVDNPVENIYEQWVELGGKNSLIYVDNKTMDRFTQVAAENKRDDVNTWNLALVYLLTSPGVPIIFQGSELPMYGSGIEQVQRLVNFNSGEPELEEVYSKVLALRTEFPVLQYGDFELVGSDQGLSVFKRTYQDETMYIAINNDSVSRTVSLTDLDSDLQLRGILGDNLVRQLDSGEYKIGLARESTDVYIIEEDSGINWMFVAPVVTILLIFVLAVIYLSRKQKKREAN